MRTMSEQTAWEVLSFLAPNLQILLVFENTIPHGCREDPKKVDFAWEVLYFICSGGLSKGASILTEPQGASGSL